MIPAGKPYKVTVNTRFALATVTLLTGCSGAQNPRQQPDSTASQSAGLTNAADNMDAASDALPSAPAPLPRYASQDDDIYSYITETTEAQKKAGEASGKVVSYKYLGNKDGTFRLAAVSGDGDVEAVFECRSPCTVYKFRDGGQTIRGAANPDSIIGAAFADAMNGFLKEAKSLTAVSSGSSVIPMAFIGEWNENPADCGSGNNDSALVIEPRQLKFYESTGRVKNVRSNDDGSITVTAAYDAEGEHWSRTTNIMLSGNDLVVDRMVRQRCP